MKFKILYHNLPPAATIIEVRLAEFGMTLTNDNSGLLDEQSYYQHKNANDFAYWKFLIDGAEQFFNERVKELERVILID